MKVGVELEYWVVDESGDLSCCADLAERLEFAEQEFVKPLFEIKSSPHSSIDLLERELRDRVGKAISEAESLGKKIVPLGTPLNSGSIDVIPSKRAEIQKKLMGKSIDTSRRVAGTHIHFEKQDVVQQLNYLIAMDPALALLNSSPYYQGRPLGSSSRNHAYRYNCLDSFKGHRQLWSYVDSVAEWEERINKHFEQFKNAGKKRGVAKDEIEKHFEPENALWNPVRLRKEFNTVEWRAPDSNNLEQVIRFVRSSKEIIEQEELARPDFERLLSLSRKSISKGSQDTEVKNYVQRLGFERSNYKDVSNRLKNGSKITEQEAAALRNKIGNEMHEKFG